MVLALKIAIAFALICFILRTIYVVLNWGEEYGYYDKYGIGNIFGAAFLSVFGGVVLMFFLWIYDWIGTPIDHYETHKVQLYGLTNKSGVQGSFMLGSGNIDNEQYIFYNGKESSSGLIRTYKVKMDDCRFDNKSDTTYLEIKNGIHEPRYGFFNPKIHEFTYTQYIFHLRPEDMNITNYYDITNY